MYTNIDTGHALQELHTFFQTLPADSVHPGLLPGIEIIMRHCLFYFNDQVWLQLSGTAMGAPPAPMYATFYFAVHESRIITKYAKHIFFYGRYIDDTLLLVNPTTFTPSVYSELQDDFNSFGKLCWMFTPLENSINFLDITLSIRDGKLHHTMFEKVLNHYLYIPPSSSHPPGVLKGLIFGRLHQFNILCSDEQDKKMLCNKLYQRLLYRGYHPSIIDPIFCQSLTLVNSSHKKPRRNYNTSIILHTKFHPCNPSSHFIQHTFWEQLIDHPDGSIANIWNHQGAPLDIDTLIVAFHRPKNLGNYLSSRRTTSITTSTFPT